MGTLARAVDTESIVGLETRSVGVAYEIFTRWIPKICGFALVKSHWQVAAQVFEGLNTAIAGDQQNAFFFKRPIFVEKLQTLGWDILKFGDQLHFSPQPASYITELQYNPKLMDRIVVFARQPVAGKVKTRLAAEIGDEAAVRVYEALLEHTLREIDGLASRLMVAEAIENGWLPPVAVKIEVQRGGDLGSRLVDAFERQFREGADAVLLIGSDCPGLRRKHLLEAFVLLEEKPVVLGPAADGGYWLIGQRAPGWTVFEGIPWSTSSTLASTRQRLVDLGLEWNELEVLDDIDTADDLRRAQEEGVCIE